MRGFTLMETLLYLALMSMLLAGSVTSAYALAASAGRHQAEAAIERDGRFLLERVRRSIQEEDVVSEERISALTPYTLSAFTRADVPDTDEEPAHTDLSFSLEGVTTGAALIRAFSITVYPFAP